MLWFLVLFLCLSDYFAFIFQIPTQNESIDKGITVHCAIQFKKRLVYTIFEKCLYAPWIPMGFNDCRLILWLLCEIPQFTANEVEKNNAWTEGSFIVWAFCLHSILIINIISLEYVPIDSHHKIVNHKVLPPQQLLQMINVMCSFLFVSYFFSRFFLTVPSNVCQCANF